MTDDPWGYVPVEPTRQRLRDLNRSGMTFTEVSKQTGLSRRYLHQLLAASTTWTTTDVQDLIYQIEMPKQPVLDQWFQHASCLGTSLDMWFPEDRLGRPSHRHLKRTQETRQICKTCPVQTDCLKYALRHSTVGIWAGTDENERKQIKKGLK